MLFSCTRATSLQQMPRCESLRFHHKMHKSHHAVPPAALLSKPHLLTPHHPWYHQPGISYQKAEGKEILTLPLALSTRCNTSTWESWTSEPLHSGPLPGICMYLGISCLHLSRCLCPSPQKQPSPPTATTSHCCKGVTRARPAQKQLHKFIQRWFCFSLSFPQKSDADKTPSLINQPAQTAIDHQFLRL